MSNDDLEYAGFWVRVGAAIIDSVLVMCLIYPILVWVYGWSYLGRTMMAPEGFTDVLVSWVLPAVAVIVFWISRQATPGKMALQLRIVDARTGGTLTIGQSLIRYLGYYVSTIPLGIGLIWVAFDPKKQGWHDKLASTVVIRSRRRGPEPVSFEGKVAEK
jgi:uncharacterized RDD family membrane protein YckC